MKIKINPFDMVGKNQLKLVKKLHQKKYRYQTRKYFVEGAKAVKTMLQGGAVLDSLYVTDKSIEEFKGHDPKVVSEQDMAKISALSQQNGVLAVFKMDEEGARNIEGWTLVLDDISDPGNLGTLIRLCDWFGFRNLVCSPNTVDVYNPKVVQATMGSLSRVNVLYTDLEKFLSKTNLPIYGTFMDGEDMNRQVWPKKGVLILGNEAQGISNAVASHIEYKVGIPARGNKLAESLNVATAGAIFLNQISNAIRP